MRAAGFLAVLGLAVAASSCGSQTAAPADRVTTVDGDDPKMNAAIAKARSTVGQMVDALKSPNGRSDFAVKMPFSQGGRGEHMWVQPVEFSGGRFTGTLANDPVTVKSMKAGQEVSAPRDEISDWMYVENGKLVGGYTLRVLRDTLSAKERSEFDQSVPFQIE
jgi:uncharacterized protein YegJ (DUF2314 family)